MVYQSLHGGHAIAEGSKTMVRNEHGLRQIEVLVAALLPEVREGMTRQERRDFLAAISGEIMSEEQDGPSSNEHRERYQSLSDFDKRAVQWGLKGMDKFYDCNGPRAWGTV